MPFTLLPLAEKFLFNLSLMTLSLSIRFCVARVSYIDTITFMLIHSCRLPRDLPLEILEVIWFSWETYTLTHTHTQSTLNIGALVRLAYSEGDRRKEKNKGRGQHWTFAHWLIHSTKMYWVCKLKMLACTGLSLIELDSMQSSAEAIIWWNRAPSIDNLI